MRSSILVAALACVAATVGCQSATVRGPAGEKVSASAPRALSIHRGESVPLSVAIDRENFSGPVTVSIAQLPKGVEVDRSTQKVETQTATFALKASRDADLVKNQAVAVTIDDTNGRRATQYVSLNVLEPKGMGGD